MSHPIHGTPLSGYQVHDPNPRLGRIRVLAVVGFFVAAFVLRVFFPQPVSFFPGPQGYVSYGDSAKGWTLRFPETWYAERYSEVHDRNERHGVVISNVKDPFGSLTELDPYSPRFPQRGFPSHGVSVEVGFAVGMHFVMYCIHDTKLPLNLKRSNLDMRTLADADGVPVKQLTKTFSVGGLPLYHVRVAVGSKASKEDIARMEEIVRSVTYEVTGDPQYGHADCSEGVTGW